ncbi:MAG: hypothetical protein FWE53_05145 [Firmicutes bacterium]|nr:hypothetical protein [Bacillota bacterium]
MVKIKSEDNSKDIPPPPEGFIYRLSADGRKLELVERAGTRGAKHKDMAEENVRTL